MLQQLGSRSLVCTTHEPQCLWHRGGGGGRLLCTASSSVRARHQAAWDTGRRVCQSHPRHPSLACRYPPQNYSCGLQAGRLLFPEDLTPASCRSAAVGTAWGEQQEPSSSSTQEAFLKVVLPTAFALMLCNMDRMCLSVAIMPMSLEFGWPASLQVRQPAQLQPIDCKNCFKT